MKMLRKDTCDGPKDTGHIPWCSDFYFCLLLSGQEKKILVSEKKKQKLCLNGSQDTEHEEQ